MKFKVGDVCVIVGGFKHHPEFIGSEVTVVGPLEWYRQYGWFTFHRGYEVEGPALPVMEEFVWMAHPPDLRLKRPPSWDSWLYDTRDVRKEKPEDTLAPSALNELFAIHYPESERNPLRLNRFYEQAERDRANYLRRSKP